MKLRTLLKLQKAVEEREIPYDVLNFDSKHYSESKGVFKNILDMDLIHLIRSYNKTLSPREE